MTSQLFVSLQTLPLMHATIHDWQRCQDMTTFQVAAPGQFNFSLLDEWPKWIWRFDQFCCTSGLSGREEENQVHTLIYSMGEEVDDILSSFEWSEADQKKYEMVKGKFESYFVKRMSQLSLRVCLTAYIPQSQLEQTKKRLSGPSHKVTYTLEYKYPSITSTP